MKKKNKWEKFKKYLGVEIGIEYKACLYFFAMMFFYCCYGLFKGNTTVPMLHMAEMIFANYIMGYIQVYLLSNFDEAEEWGVREMLAAVLCTGIYAALSYVLNWFGKNLWVTIGFVAYILFAYFCMFLVNKIKREQDTKQLNSMLEAYKEENSEERY